MEYLDVDGTAFLAVAATRDGRFQTAAVVHGTEVAVVRFTGVSP